MFRMPRSKTAARSTSALSTAVEAAARVELLTLEPRLLMTHVTDNGLDNDGAAPLPQDIGVTPVVHADSSTTNATTTAAAATAPLTSIPALSSRPAAAAKLYLDFD